MSSSLSRRRFLQLAGLGGLGVLAGWPPFSLSGSNLLAAEDPASELAVDLQAARDAVPILPGRNTEVWRFRGTVLSGDQGQLVANPESYLGPTFRVRKGQTLSVNFRNQLPEPSIVHWHGLHVPDDMDGHPRLVVAGGETYPYRFKVLNRAGTYWYHPHPHNRTGFQVYGGMAGFFIVHDEEEDALGLPSGEFDVPLLLQDRRFDASNQLVYVTSPQEWMHGLLGDTVLINGRPRHSMEVARRSYRLRLLNGSNSRIYKLAWEDGTPLTVIGTDGGLLERPEPRDFLYFGPGERLDLWVDFSNHAVGSTLRLISRSEPALSETGMGMMRSGAAVPNGAPLSLLTFKVARESATNQPLPKTLTPLEPVSPEQAYNHGRPKTFQLQMSHMRWTINGRSFQMYGVAPEEVVRLGRPEIWEFVNDGHGMGRMGGMGRGRRGRGRGGRGMMGMMQMPHPMHIHGLQFRVINRIGPWPSAGFMDQGWKDTVLVMPGERVQVLVNFPHYSGLFLYHCHILEHEDRGMMRNLEVRP